MIIIAAIRKFLRLDNEIISLDNELINSTGLMMEASKDFMQGLQRDGCIELIHHSLNYNGNILPTHHIHVGDISNC